MTNLDTNNKSKVLANLSTESVLDIRSAALKQSIEIYYKILEVDSPEVAASFNLLNMALQLEQFLTGEIQEQLTQQQQQETNTNE